MMRPESSIGQICWVHISEEERHEWECSACVALTSLSLRWRDQSKGEVNLLVRKRSVVFVGMLLGPKFQVVAGCCVLKQRTADLLVLNWRFHVVLYS